MARRDPPALTRRHVLKGLAALAVATALHPGAVRATASGPHTRAVPSSGERLPVIGLGTSRTFDVGTAETERAALRDVLRLFVEHGGRVVDTSPMYGNAERVVGELAGELGLHDKLFLATKVWTSGEQAGVEQMRASMDRLQARRLDLMQVHNLVDTDTHLRTLAEWKQQGLVRYVGITHYRSDAFDDLAAVIRSHPLDFVQLNYSLEEPEAEQALLPLAADRGVAVIVNRPFARGDLFRRLRGREVPPWAAELDIDTWAQFLLKFVVGHLAVTCAIPATSKPKHLVDNMQAGYGALPDEPTRRRMLQGLRDL